MKHESSLILLVVAAVFSSSCSKDKGGSTQGTGHNVGASTTLASAQALYDHHEFGAALEAFTRLATLPSGNDDARNAAMMIGLCYESMGNLDKAEEAFRGYSENYTPTSAGYYYYGTILEQRGKSGKAQEYFKKASQSRDSPSWVKEAAAERMLEISAQTHYDAKEFGLALTEFQKIVSRSSTPQVARNAQMMVGLSQQRLGRLGNADEAFRVLLQKYSPSGPAYYYFGEILMGEGKNDEARTMFEKALSVSDCPDWAKKSAQTQLDQ